MEIAILTFSAAYNYGALLQAYALQEHLILQGHNVEMIDYNPKYFRDFYKVIPQSTHKGIYGFIRVIIREILHFITMPRLLKFRINKNRSFKNFINNYFNLTSNTYSKIENLDGYDAIIFGSDQIWSFDATHTDYAFFADFNIPKNTLKIAYAASVGGAIETLIKSKKAIELIKNFDFVSAREETLSNVLSTVLNKEIPTVLDPTLLVDKSIWNKFCKNKILDTKYILVYEVIGNPNIDKIAKKMAKQFNAKIIKLWSGKISFNDYTKGLNPAEFVNLFKYATCVLTTSFHGTAFSLIFKKDFYFIYSGHKSENRATQILQQLDLMDRFTSDKDIEFKPIDWNLKDFDKKFENLKTDSKDFLENALKQ